MNSNTQYFKMEINRKWINTYLVRNDKTIHTPRVFLNFVIFN